MEDVVRVVAILELRQPVHPLAVGGFYPRGALIRDEIGVDPDAARTQAVPRFTHPGLMTVAVTIEWRPGTDDVDLEADLALPDSSLGWVDPADSATHRPDSDLGEG